MKIVVVQGAFLPVPPVEGGAVEKMWYLLAKEFVKQGHQVVYLCKSFKSMPTEEVIDGVQIRRKSGFDFSKNFFLSNLKDLRYTLAIKKLIPKDADVIISNTFWLPILLNKKLASRTLVDVARMPKGQMPLYKQVKILRANSSPVSKAIKKELSQALHKKVCVIPNPLTFINPKPVDYTYKEKIILYVGRIHPEKGIDLLIEAFNQMNLEQWKLKVIGPHKIASGGGGEAYLKQLKDAAHGNIQFSAPIYDIEELNGEYHKASIFVYPSLAEKGETFGLAPLEAMAWGTAPLVSNLECFKDFIIDGVNGSIFDHRVTDAVKTLKAKLEDMTKDINHLKKMQDNALAVRKTHSIPEIAKQFLKVF